jgi:hypothetical protein
MKEDGASAALDARPLIVAGFYDYIIELIRAFKLLMGGGVGQVNSAVIVSVANRLAPAPALSDR